MIRETDTRLGLVQTTDTGSVEAFRRDPRFQLVFFDDLSLVFVRDDALPPDVEPYRVLAPEDLNLGFLAGADDTRVNEALTEAVRATTLDPDGSRAWMLRGALARRIGDLDQSLDALDRAIELDPTQMSYHNQRGVTLLDIERTEEARRSFERAVALDPRSYAARYNLGLAWVRLDQAGRAERSFRRALGLAPEAAEVRLMLGALEDRPARARGYLEEAIALSDDPALVARAKALLVALD